MKMMDPAVYLIAWTNRKDLQNQENESGLVTPY